MFDLVKAGRNRWVCFWGTGLLVTIAQVALADLKENSYSTIVERNVFGLKPPPPPPVELPPTQNTPQVTVELTGITSILSKKKALLEILEPGPGKTPKKPIMEEGDRIDAIEVIAIDVEKSQVRIRNAGVESNLTFKVAKSSSTPGAPGAPGLPAPQLTPYPASANAAAAGPTIISPNRAGGAFERGGVTLVGGGTPGVTASAGATAATITAGGTAPASAYYGAAANTALGSTAPGLRNIPSRQIRTPPAEVQGAPPPVDPVHQYINLKAQELKANQEGRSFPPTPTIPGLE